AMSSCPMVPSPSGPRPGGPGAGSTVVPEGWPADPAGAVTSGPPDPLAGATRGLSRGRPASGGQGRRLGDVPQGQPVPTPQAAADPARGAGGEPRVLQLGGDPAVLGGAGQLGLALVGDLVGEGDD